jgi:hypothetical protein
MEFGKMVKRQEAENQILVDYEICDRKLNDCGLPIPASKTMSRPSLAHPIWSPPPPSVQRRTSGPRIPGVTLGVV